MYASKDNVFEKHFHFYQFLTILIFKHTFCVPEQEMKLKNYSRIEVTDWK